MIRMPVVIPMIFLLSCSPLESNFLIACEALIKQKLQFPKTYQRLDVHSNRDTDVPGPTNLTLVVTYEATEAVDIVKRDQVLCKHFSEDGNVTGASTENVTLETLN